MRDYVEITYKDYPYTRYPAKLTAYLVQRFKIPMAARLLDVGCGRGEYVDGFNLGGLRAEGCDLSKTAKILANEIGFPFHSGFPFICDYWDVMFSKSLLEHLHHPEETVDLMFRFLKPGGLCIAMVPDYEVCWRGFYGDCTHVHPFMQSSLAELFTWAGFDDVKCEKFLQSPPLWKAPWKRLPLALRAKLPGASKDAEFAQKKYTMLLCSGRKA